MTYLYFLKVNLCDLHDNKHRVLQSLHVGASSGLMVNKLD